MASDLNTGMLVGRLATDPELRSVGDTSVCQFRLAFNTSKRNSYGDYEDKGNFVDVKVWGKQGENVARLQSKGKRIGIAYRVEVETWQTQDNQNRSKVVFVAERVQFLDPKDGDGGGGGGSNSAPQSNASRKPPEDDDIPF